MYEFKKLYTIDFSNVKYYMEVHPILQRALDFPEYYGGSLDALWDCLTDMVGRPIHIEIIGLEVIERKFSDYAKKLVDTFKEFKHYDNDKYSHEIQIEIVSGKSRVSLR
ncbi:MAG: barstar family protein [Clostridia bacterium]|nr:barstar family protein [Clostridia bacterium]